MQFWRTPVRPSLLPPSVVVELKARRNCVVAETTSDVAGFLDFWFNGTPAHQIPTTDFTYLSVGPNISHDGMSYTRYVAAVTTEVGRSPIRPGDWLMSPIGDPESRYPQMWVSAPWYAFYRNQEKVQQAFTEALQEFGDDLMQMWPSDEVMRFVLSRCHELGVQPVTLSYVVSVTDTLIEIADAVPTAFLVWGEFFSRPLPYLAKVEKDIHGESGWRETYSFENIASMPASDAAAALEAFSASARLLPDQWPFKFNKVDSMSALMKFLSDHQLDLLADALDFSWFDRFFVEKVGRSEANVVTSSGSGTSLIGLEGGEPESIPDRLNPNADPVEYREEDDREF
jgi:hypothetical protein